MREKSGAQLNMWKLDGTPPIVIEAEVFTRLPAQFAVARRSE